MDHPPAYQIFPLGDTAVTIDFGNMIDEAINGKVLALYSLLSADPLPAMTEAVPAYSSLTVYFDIYKARKKALPGQTAADFIISQLHEKLKLPLSGNTISSSVLTIPVCYDLEFAPDLEELASINHLSIDEVIRIHTSRQYTVFMLGFLPGFSYMGEVDEKIAMPRKSQPVNVAAGSVGIAGRQTGIYPFVSPGGWQIIGRTPLQLFETKAASNGNIREESFCLLHPGNKVQFISISKNEFENY